MSRLLRHALAAMLVCAPLAAVACGGSDKPGYCADRSQLESSIKDLTSLNPANGLSGLQSQLSTIEQDAKTLVASARSDFPKETNAISTSVDALASDVRALPSSPSASQITSLAGDATNVIGAVGDFMDATKSKCD